MKKMTLLAAAMFAAIALPALAQQSPTGQSSGGPARVGNPGEVGGGVPGTRPGVGAPDQMRPMGMGSRRMMKRRMMKRRMMRRSRRMM